MPFSLEKLHDLRLCYKLEMSCVCMLDFKLGYCYPAWHFTACTWWIPIPPRPFFIFIYTLPSGSCCPCLLCLPVLTLYVSQTFPVNIFIKSFNQQLETVQFKWSSLLFTQLFAGSPDSQEPPGLGCSTGPTGSTRSLGRTIIVPPRTFCRTPESETAKCLQRPTTLPLRTLPAISITTPDTRSDILNLSQRIHSAELMLAITVQPIPPWGIDTKRVFASFLLLFSSCQSVVVLSVWIVYQVTICRLCWFIKPMAICECTDVIKKRASLAFHIIRRYTSLSTNNR